MSFGSIYKKYNNSSKVYFPKILRTPKRLPTQPISKSATAPRADKTPTFIRLPSIPTSAKRRISPAIFGGRALPWHFALGTKRPLTPYVNIPPSSLINIHRRRFACLRTCTTTTDAPRENFSIFSELVAIASLRPVCMYAWRRDDCVIYSAAVMESAYLWVAGVRRFAVYAVWIWPFCCWRNVGGVVRGCFDWMFLKGVFRLNVVESERCCLEIRNLRWQMSFVYCRNDLFQYFY